ncbi:MAG: N-acetylmuramoyl-L-alanine amidase [Candidatus Metalachnospira sp.]|nr:N-acetylmuramoyl-L-alanine amidase [Candidatus Metalachnospira sp.]
MNLLKLIFTNNACYKAGKLLIPKGIMVHSTGANNPNLKRYVGPDDGLLGANSAKNHWNTNKPDGREVCVHAFIGRLKDGSIATYQTLPWNMQGWHCGGTGNNNYIGFEICEDDLTDSTYFNKVYHEAVELCVYLCKQFNFTEKNIICHSEGHELGIASNHSDVMHWFPKHGKSMDTFRADVKAGLAESAETPAKSDFKPYSVKVSIPSLNIRKGPGTDYDKTGKYTGIGTFTIVEEQSGKGAIKWGRLKSGLGWISLDYAEKIK